MNEVFKKVEEILEELRCEAEEREYFVQTEQAEKAAQELKKVNREYGKILIEMPEEYRIFLEKYMDIVDHANFQEQQRAYYQGIVDAIQILAGLKIIKENDYINKIIDRFEFKDKEKVRNIALQYLQEKER